MNLLHLIGPLAGEDLLLADPKTRPSRSWARVHITHVTGNPADVIPGCLFVATGPDPRRKIRRALSRGACAVVAGPQHAGEGEDLARHLTRLTGSSKPEIIRVRDAGRSLAILERSFYQQPSDQMQVIGITGTNGKTMTAFMINAILEECGMKTGLLSTVSNKIGPLATPASGAAEPVNPQPALRAMREAGAEAAIVEFSSRSLAKGTSSGVSLDIAILTNIALEHLTFHRNLKSYLAAKSRLLAALKPGGAVLYNADDPLAARLSSQGRALSFGIEQEAHFRALDIQSSCYGSIFRIKTAPGLAALDGSSIPEQELPVRLKIPGRHQVYNALAACATGLLLSLPVPGITRAFERFPGVKRRFELIFDGSFRVIDDCARNPGSIHAALLEARRLAGRLIVVHALSAEEGIKTSRKNSLAFTALIPILQPGRVIICGRAPSRVKTAFLAELHTGGIDVSSSDDLASALNLAIAGAGEGDLILLTGGHGMDQGARILAERLAVSPQLAYEEPFEEFDSGPLTLPLAGDWPSAPLVTPPASREGP